MKSRVTKRMVVRRSQFSPFPLVAGISIPQSDLFQERNGLFCNWGTQYKERIFIAMQEPLRRKECWEYSFIPAP